MISYCFVRLYYRVKRRDSYTAADADNRPFFLDMRRVPERAQYGSDFVARIKARQFHCGRAHRLKNDGNPPFFCVGICNR